MIIYRNLPFLWYFHYQTFRRLFFISSRSQTSLKKEQRNPTDVGKSTLSISAWIASMPVALPFFKNLMTSHTSLNVGVFTLNSRSLEADEGKTVYREHGWFKTLLKCLTQLAACSRSVVSIGPPTIPDDCWKFLTGSAQSNFYLVERWHITFVGILVYLLFHLISKSSFVSSGILLNFLIRGVVVLLDSFTDPFRFWIE